MTDLTITFLQEEQQYSETETALIVRDGCTFEQWAAMGNGLSREAKSLPWRIGDWLNFGVKNYGDKRALAIDHAARLGLQPEYVRNVMRVCSQVACRHASLSFSHHNEVAACSPTEQEGWLGMAIDKEWSVSQLRQAIRAANAEYTDEAKAAPIPLNTHSWALDFMRTIGAEDVSQWPQERRALVKADIEPIVRFYEAL